jgi:hypothetical protein
MTVVGSNESYFCIIRHTYILRLLMPCKKQIYFLYKIGRGGGTHTHIQKAFNRANKNKSNSDIQTVLIEAEQIIN